MTTLLIEGGWSFVILTYGDVFLNKIYILPCIFHYRSSVLSLSIKQHSFNFSTAGFFLRLIQSLGRHQMRKAKKRPTEPLAKFSVQAENLDQFSEKKTGA